MRFRSGRKWKILTACWMTLALLGAAMLGLAGPSAAGQHKLPEISFEKYRLQNGLEVIMHVDRSLPMVTVNVWYHVGSKNEKKGRTGFAHLFEHLMFEGSEHIPSFDEPMERIGGNNNGSTSNDRTNYWSNLPANYLEMGLWLEADRMGYLLPVMTHKKLDTQRGVVQNEKRQGVDNQPYGRANEILMQMLYPSDHPYSWTVIGSLEDLSAATLQDVKGFFRRYYTPNNASLCIAGDFDPGLAKKLVEKHFASLPPGPPVARLKSWVPELQSEIRAVVGDKIELARVYMAWHTPALYAPGDAEFDLLADILSSGKTSRLYQALVYEQEIAQDISAYQGSRELGSTFHVTATAREGHSLEELEAAIDAELGRILAEGVGEQELEAARTNREASFIRRMERVGGFGGKADMLNGYNVYLGEPGRFQWDLDRYARVTAVDVAAYARRYLGSEKRVVVQFLPHGDPSAAEERLDRSEEPAPLPEPRFSPPEIRQAELSNGARLFLVEDHSLPLLQVNLVFKNGWAADPSDRPGAAALTADLLDEGTGSRTALEIAEEARALGAYLSTDSSFDSSDVNLNVLKSRLDRGLGLMADIVLHPVFPAQELERKKKLYLGRIQQESRQPFTTALKLFFQRLYGEGHPYAQPYTGSGTAASIRAITRGDLQRFYQSFYSPDQAAFVVVGDITLSEAREKLERAFSGWGGRGAEPPPVPRPEPPASTRIYLLDMPGAAQSAIVAGNLALQRGHPDYTACEVVNNALGGMFTSRINTNLREEKAYTYGASSFFFGTREPGPFVCYTQVETQYTDEAVFEIVKELRDIGGSRPLKGAELAASRDNLINSFPGSFEILSGIAFQVDEIYSYDLSSQEWAEYVPNVRRVDERAALEAAQKYIRADALLIVVVGDRARIEPELRDLGLGEVRIIREEFEAER
jgi:zinc protease